MQLKSGDQDINNKLTLTAYEDKLEHTNDLIDHLGLTYLENVVEKYILLCAALKYGQREIAIQLLMEDSKVNDRNYEPYNTPLHFAVENDDIEIVKLLLNKGAYTNARNQYEKTPLFYAIENKKIEITKLLLAYNADVNARDKNDINPLQLAIEIECSQSVGYLLEHGAYVNSLCTSIGKKNYTPLHLAALNDNKEIIMILLNKGANINARGEDNITPLYISSERGYEDIVILFLNNGANVNIRRRNNVTPLYIATKRGHKLIVKLLLQYGGNVNDKDKYGITILHLAVKRGYLMIVEDILKYGPDINNKVNKNALKIAVYGNGLKYKKIALALLNYGFKINPNDLNNSSLFHSSIEKGFIEIIENQLQHSSKTDSFINSKSNKGYTALHIAVKDKAENIVNLLISHGANVNLKDKYGKSPIFYAIQNTDLKLTNLLLINGANVKNSPILLNRAIKKGCLEIIEALIHYGADVKTTDAYGRTALHFTVLNENADVPANSFVEEHIINVKVEIAKLLLSKGANINAQTNSGLTTLHVANEKGYLKVVEFLLERNADINICDINGQTALHFIVLKDAEDSFKYFPRNNHNINIKVELIKLLLNKGANVNAQTKTGLTVLHVATQKSFIEIIKILLEYNANVNCRTKFGITPLHLATEKGSQDIVELLLKFGADINSRENFGRTVLHIAARHNHEKIIKTLLDYGSLYRIILRRNGIPLHYLMNYIQEYFSNERVYYDLDCMHMFSSKIIESFKIHTVKLKAANLYINTYNVQSIENSKEMIAIENQCKKEILSMMSEKINNTNISYYDILVKSTNSLAMCMQNENIEHIVKSEVYETKFPIYASLIKCNFTKSKNKKELIEKSNKIFDLASNQFSKLPYICTEKIFNYLSDNDLRIFIYACTYYPRISNAH